MSKTLSAFCCLLFSSFVFTGYLEAEWTPIPGITIYSTSTGAVSDEPQIGIDALGNATAVWREYDSTNNTTSIRFATFSKCEDGWSSPHTISSAVGNNGDALPQIAVTPFGYSVVVWGEKNGVLSTVKSATRGTFGDDWSSPLTISAPTTGSNQVPQVAIDVVGNAVAIWIRNDGNNDIAQAATLFLNAPSWTNLTNLSDISKDASHPQVGLDASGNGVAVWTQADDQIIQSRTYSRGTWLPTIANLSDTLSDIPELDVNPSGVAVAVWTRMIGSTFITEASRLVDGVWSTATDISAGSLTNSFAVPGPGATVAVDLAGNALAVWSQSAAGNYPVFIESAYLSAGSSIWSPPTIISPMTGFAFDARAEFDNKGNLFSVWDIDNTIQGAILPAGKRTWRVTDLSVIGEGAIFPQIAIDPSGFVVVTWQNISHNNVQATTYVSAPCPPTNFVGRIKENKFLNKTVCSLSTTWEASPSADIIFYRIYKNAAVVSTVAASSPLVYTSNLMDCSAKFAVTAVNSNGEESSRVALSR
jgi:hypothetical protein